VIKTRYLIKDKCTALPQKKAIFDDYVMPRDVWDALEAEKKRVSSLSSSNDENVQIKSNPLDHFASIPIEDIYMV
jgi:hypothetical protein